jgi:hypothetical protein
LEDRSRLRVDRQSDSTPLRPAQGAIGRATLDEVTLGEHRHLVLQALCRGSVRRCQGTECAPCDAYIIAATRSGIPAALPDIFPGCRVVRWQPVQKALSGKVKEAAEFLIDWFKKNPEGLLSFNSRVKRSGWIPRTSERTFAVIQDSRKRSRTTTSQKPRSLATAGVAS